MKLNILKLNQELYYHPAWYKDKEIFFLLLRKSDFQDDDILLLGQLYIKYSHLHYFHSSELTNYFNYIIKKIPIDNFSHLFNHTKHIYSKYNFITTECMIVKKP